MKKEYYLGLDMGTESIGWAVTDSQYHILKKNQKALWGVRLFDESQSAQERRTARIARRRLQRRNQRLQWLQEQFSDSVAKVDAGFFLRLKESFYRPDHKDVGKYTLFCNKDYNDTHYHTDYPTIYHLRYALATQAKAFDVRLVYLAIHHILKKRGHFLYGQLSLNQITFQGCVDELSKEIAHQYDIQFTIENPQTLEDVLCEKKMVKAQKKKNIIQAVGDAPSAVKSLLELLSGGKVKVRAMFEDVGEETELISFSLEEDFGELEPKLLSVLDEDKIRLIRAVKALYDYTLLKKLRDGETFISAAKIKSYDKHGADLSILKGVFHRFCPEIYTTFFHKSAKKLNNYVAYTGHDNTANYRCNYENFSKELKKILSPYKEDASVSCILGEIENGTFLPMQVTGGNSVIPYQLHEMELVAILNNASAYLPFLSDIDDTGLSVKEKILKIFQFRIPFYIGPLSKDSAFAWLERTDEKIYPWNFSSVVDLEKSAENFITRMTSKCSYLGEDVIPKDSLLYSRFMVLNTLNKVKINNEPISVQQKQDIYHNLFLNGRKVSEKMLKSYCVSQGYMSKADTIQGLDKEFKTTLSTNAVFAHLLGSPEKETMVEDIITHIVLFGEDGALLGSWLDKTYGDYLTKQEQKKILGKKFSGWGKLSRTFLTELYHVDENTGEAFSVMDMLWLTNQNLMELLSSDYIFGTKVQQFQIEKMKSLSFDLATYLDESYAAPGIKRAIFQTLAITDEVTKIMRTPPVRIFVEVAREDGEKKATVSRKNKLMELYRGCGEESNELFSKLEGEPEGNLRRDKLYFYYTQLGKCMYSGKPISLEELDANYDIDHIYPQSLTKDDSLNNRVLVLKTLNGAKSNQMIPEDIRRKMEPLWGELERKGLISKEKYQRLTRTTQLTDSELEGFINRQLVETRQSSKIVADLLKKRYPDSEVIYVKAGHVSNFRQEQQVVVEGKRAQNPLFVKCRDVNDYHHAKDAYLNIVVGNVYHVKFTKNPRNFLKTGKGTYSLNRMFDFDVVRDDDVAWRKGEEGTISTVCHTMSKNNILSTRMVRDVGGALYDLQIMPKGKGQAAIKSSDPRLTTEHYGGYNKRTGAYFVLVAYTKKRKRVRSIEPVYLMDKLRFEKDPLNYCKTKMGLEDPKILIPHIPMNSLFSLDGFRMTVSGRTGEKLECRNAHQLVLSVEMSQYVKEVGKYSDRCKVAKTELPLTPFDKITSEKNEALYIALVDKLRNTLFNRRYSNELQKLEKRKELFRTLSTKEQCDILLQILNLFRCNKSNVDLSLLKESNQSGKIRPTKNIDIKRSQPFFLIHQSPTGFFESSVDLLAEEDGF